jgi:hypothetical protein
VIGAHIAGVPVEEAFGAGLPVMLVFALAVRSSLGERRRVWRARRRS